MEVHAQEHHPVLSLAIELPSSASMSAGMPAPLKLQQGAEIIAQAVSAVFSWEMAVDLTVSAQKLRAQAL